MIAPFDRFRPLPSPFAICFCFVFAALCVAASPSAKAFLQQQQQQQQRTIFPLVQIVDQQQQLDSDAQTVPTHFRPSSIAFLCANSFPPSPQLAQMCADLTGIVLLPSADDNDGPRRPILIGPEGIGIGTQRKRHFWSGRIAAFEGRAENGALETNGGGSAEKRGYDYIRFGRRSSAAFATPKFAKQQRKKSADTSGARTAYDYIRFG
ncbi:hypothetical protein niasHT_030806 [Heterodera trifolii]|uniref:Uncharacterized protein n=1 Tax=Heterodera trifolii TaxID=157864 RepID=A0ABD2HUS9_9BILA